MEEALISVVVALATLGVVNLALALWLLEDQRRVSLRIGELQGWRDSVVRAAQKRADLGCTSPLYPCDVLPEKDA